MVFFFGDPWPWLAAAAFLFFALTFSILSDKMHLVLGNTKYISIFVLGNMK